MRQKVKGEVLCEKNHNYCGKKIQEKRNPKQSKRTKENEDKWIIYDYKNHQNEHQEDTKEL